MGGYTLVVQRQLDPAAGVPRRPHRVVGELANTDRVTHDALWVGVYPGLTQPMLAYMVESFGEFARAGLIVGLTIHLYAVTTLSLVVHPAPSH